MVFEVVQHRPNATLSEGGWGLARSGHIDQLKGLCVIYVGAEFSLSRFYECSSTTICMCVLHSFSGCYANVYWDTTELSKYGSLYLIV